jgi:ribosomal protein L11 methyltransferase
MSDELLRVQVPVPPGDEELARARMIELSAQGFEELVVDGGLALVAYTDAAGAAEIEARFPNTTVRRVAAGWEDAWRGFHHGVVAGGIWIGPPWEAPPPRRPAVVIDPGRAFGTGAHATTRLCVELLATLRRGSLLDVGCGSGVLAIAGARLGFDPVFAVDVDPVAVEVTRVNAAANDVVIGAGVADATAEQLPATDVAVANVLLAPVESILRGLDATHAVTSGYLAGELPSHPGWEHLRSVEVDGWAADLFGRRTV